jgi:segregation and condensation protein A
MAYRVKLDVFEGPFDLLLFLIRKHEVDIYDIPIHDITEQFQEYVNLMKMLDLEIAGEFIEMVAILMHIKARMLLPKPLGVSDEDYEDPRTELVERLIEYQRFKEAAAEMYEFESHQRQMFKRKYFTPVDVPDETSNEEYLSKVSLFDLLLAFKKALDNMPKITYHEVKKIEVNVEQQAEYILNKLDVKSMILFSEIMQEIKEKIIVVITFLALLDLIKAQKIIVRQSNVFDDIRIKKVA